MRLLGGSNLCKLIPALIGVVLITAAALKGYQLTVEPLGSRWLTIALIEVELAVGLALLLGVSPYASRVAAVACFTLFLGVALFKAVAGAERCGCFGPVPVSPWLAAALDLSALFGLILATSPLRIRCTPTLPI